MVGGIITSQNCGDIAIPSSVTLFECILSLEQWFWWWSCYHRNWSVRKFNILPVLAGDYTTCLKFLMRYPASADVQYIIQLALHLRNPKVSCSSLMQYDHSCCIAVFFFPVVDTHFTLSMLQQYPRPPGYSSTATHHIPTVGGRPDVHRGPQHHSAPQARSSSVPRTTQQVMYSLSLSLSVCLSFWVSSCM